MAAPTKFNKCEQAILRALRGGTTRTDAALAAGISYETLRVWIRDNLEFSAAVTRAEAECANRMAAAIHDAARKHLVRRTKTTTRPDGTVEVETVETREFDWRAALEWLRRRRRDEWSDNQVVTVLQRAAEEVRELGDKELLALLGGDDGDQTAPGAGGGETPGADPGA